MQVRRVRAPLVVAAAAALLTGLLAACGAPGPSATVIGPGSAQPGGTGASLPTPSASPSSASPGATSGEPATGFAFDAESVLGYYRSVGYACEAPVADPRVEGGLATSCQLVDADGRTRTIGVVTGADGALVDGFASMVGTEGEDFLDPTIALEPLAGFLGAMLGEDRGMALVPWLAGYLGDPRAATTSGDLVIETYTQDAAGRITLFVEVRSPTFGEAP